MPNSDMAAQAFAVGGGPVTQGKMVATRDSVYSYDECIARRVTRDGKEAIELNENHYSMTTSRHRNAVRRAIEDWDWSVADEQPDDLPDGWVLYT